MVDIKVNISINADILLELRGANASQVRSQNAVCLDVAKRRISYCSESGFDDQPNECKLQCQSVNYRCSLGAISRTNAMRILRLYR